MPYAITNDNVELYYEEAGNGHALIFVHEFAGDWRSWEPQMRFFSRYFRCITFSARGYPPSGVPEDVARYSQARARDDVIAVLDHLKIDRAHVVGLSMGGFATLHVGIAYPERVRSLVIAGCGYGARPGMKQPFRDEIETSAALFDQEMAQAARRYTISPNRVPYQNKDPRGWAEFARQMEDHSALGSANTLRGVMKERPALWELIDEMQRIAVPALIVCGDEDEACLEPSLLMKRAIPSAGLLVVPRAGHTNNLEDTEMFNRALQDFFIAVELGRCGLRDPRSMKPGLLTEPKDQAAR
jgi:pimeloyl-ACP methyl ester carboxylesterase